MTTLTGAIWKPQEGETAHPNEWLLYPLNEAESRDVLELVEARNKVASTCMTPASGTRTCTPPPYPRPPATEFYSAYTIWIEGESIRKQ